MAMRMYRVTAPGRVIFFITITRTTGCLIASTQRGIDLPVDRKVAAEALRNARERGFKIERLTL